jgi:mRNA interferase MazF
MVRPTYVPARGDIVWLDFNPQLGHEQRGRRPALTISPKSYNEKVGLGLFCPITGKTKNFPFIVGIAGNKINGSILSDQIKSLDWTERNIEFIEKAEDQLTEEVIERVLVLIQ